MGAGLRDEDYRELLLLRTGLRRFTRQSESFARDAGLTPAQHQLLLAIRGHDAPEGPMIADVANYLLLRHHSVVELIDRAVSADLVARREDSRDARVVRLKLTDAGDQALERLSTRNLDELRRLADRFRPLWHGLDDAKEGEGRETRQRRPGSIRVVCSEDVPGPQVGIRVLVDRTWPRGMPKNRLSIDHWLPELAPSMALHRSLRRHPEHFREFAKRYRSDLRVSHAESLDALLELKASEPLALVTASIDIARSAASVLASELRRRGKVCG